MEGLLCLEASQENLGFLRFTMVGDHSPKASDWCQLLLALH
jgi:hypothetical protein